MKRTAEISVLVVVMLSMVMALSAQIAPRATISASDNNDAADAYGFNPDAQIIVTDVETADTEAPEPEHSCLTPPDKGNHSVWFKSVLMPGTVTLNTAGSSFDTGAGPSSDTVLSIYRFTDSGPEGFDSFSELTPVSCDDTTGTEASLNNLLITFGGTFYIQVSAAPSVTATGASTIILNAGYTASTPQPFDEPDQAKKMKLPNLPSMSNISSATVSLTEPEDPLAPGPVTNTVWAKFKLTTKRIVGFQNFYFNSASLFFSIFTKVGNDYDPAVGTILSFPDVILATLNPGTYYLRIGVLDEPAGTESTFITFTSIAYMMPTNYNFSLGFTEGTSNATEDFTGWSMKNGTAGPGGDGVVCETSSPYDCFFQFTSDGVTEKTQLKANVVLKDVVLKKGDIIRFQPSLSDMFGEPNFQAKLVLKSASGGKQVYVFNVTDGNNTEPSLTATVPSGFKPVLAKLKFTNKDTDAGDFVEIDGVVVAALRVGEGLRGPLSVPLFGSNSSAWAPQRVLPVPLPAK